MTICTESRPDGWIAWDSDTGEILVEDCECEADAIGYAEEEEERRHVEGSN